MLDWIVKYLTIDTHKLTVYTENGRPEVSFVVSETFDVEVEENKANHIFFYVDIAIFAAIILGYTTFTITKKSKRKEK